MYLHDLDAGNVECLDEAKASTSGVATGVDAVHAVLLSRQQEVLWAHIQAALLHNCRARYSKLSEKNAHFVSKAKPASIYYYHRRRATRGWSWSSRRSPCYRVVSSQISSSSAPICRMPSSLDCKAILLVTL